MPSSLSDNGALGSVRVGHCETVEKRGKKKNEWNVINQIKLLSKIWITSYNNYDAVSQASRRSACVCPGILRLDVFDGQAIARRFFFRNRAPSLRREIMKKTAIYFLFYSSEINFLHSPVKYCRNHPVHVHSGLPFLLGYIQSRCKVEAGRTARTPEGS